MRFNVRDGVRRKKGAKVEEHDNRVFNNNLGDEPSLFSRFFSTLDWLDSASWSAYRALVVVLLLLVTLLKLFWRFFFAAPLAHLTGTTQNR